MVAEACEVEVEALPEEGEASVTGAGEVVAEALEEAGEAVSVLAAAAQEGVSAAGEGIEVLEARDLAITVYGRR